MKSYILTTLTLLTIRAVADCHGDNCANHVTGTWEGIGVPIATRISICNDFLRTTITPTPRTVTSTITKYITRTTNSTSTSRPTFTSTSTTTRSTADITTTAHDGNQTTIPSAIPTFATNQCPGDGQFSSACKCWAKVTPPTSTLPTRTVTVTTTTSLDVGCGPAATAVTDGTRFPCSGNEGMCSCLRNGDSNTCVQVGAFLDGSSEWTGHIQTNVTGPCSTAKECDVDGRCAEPGYLCVYDGSCGCGKRRCYKAAPNGCLSQGLPSYGLRKRVIRALQEITRPLTP